MIILVFLVIFKVLFLVFPSAVLQAARDGLVLWFNNIIPALLPFMVVVNMLTSMGFAQVLGRAFAPVTKKIFGLPGVGGFALLVGFLSGYPMGAKVVADLHKAGALSARDAQHMLAFCNNAGPLFILGVVGAGLYGNITVGYALWLGHVASALILGLLFRLVSPPQSSPGFSTMHLSPPITSAGKALGEAVKNAMESMAIIGGLVIFFSAALAGLGQIGLPSSGSLAGLAAGLVEMTIGARKVSESAPSVATLGVTAFIVAFGGLSVHMQAFHFLEGTGLKSTVYLACKVLHGLLAAAITIFICLFPVFAVK